MAVLNLIVQVRLPTLLEMCCVGASIVTCNLGPAVGVGFFQIRVPSFIVHILSVRSRHTQYFKNCITKPCHKDIHLFKAQKCLQRFKFDGDRTEQFNSVQPLPSGATVSAKVPFNKRLHYNHNYISLALTNISFALTIGFQTKDRSLQFVKMRATPFLRFSCGNDFLWLQMLSIPLINEVKLFTKLILCIRVRSSQ